MFENASVPTAIINYYLAVIKAAYLNTIKILVIQGFSAKNTDANIIGNKSMVLNI